jgi:hypothetical protein
MDPEDGRLGPVRGSHEKAVVGMMWIQGWRLGPCARNPFRSLGLPGQAGCPAAVAAVFPKAVQLGLRCADDGMLY